MSEQTLKRAQDLEKKAALLDPSMQAVNPQWKARQILLLSNFNEEDIKDAFSPDTFAQKELLSEAAEAEKMILEGKKPKINRGADSNYMQHIIDFATNTETLSDEQYKKLMDFAMAHTDIAIENEARNIKEMIRQKRLEAMATATPPSTPTAPVVPNKPVSSPMPMPPQNTPAGM
jgi:uncharacterized protein YueI